MSPRSRLAAAVVAPLATLCILLPAPCAAKAPKGRFVVDAKGETVLDTVTKLTWQRVVSSKLFDWSAAKSYCAALTLAGKGGWRLPNIRELLSLVDLGERTPSIDTTAFPGTPSAWFWSASAVHGSWPVAWHVSFYYGNSDSTGVIYKYRARCVR